MAHTCTASDVEDLAVEAMLEVTAGDLIADIIRLQAATAHEAEGRSLKVKVAELARREAALRRAIHSAGLTP